MIVQTILKSACLERVVYLRNMCNFKIYSLGCGSAKPTLKHQPSCTVVNHGSNLYMVDCGEGAQLSFIQARLKPSRLSDIFLTHLHGDHILGLPGLISSLSLAGIRNKLTIHTFEEGKKFLEYVFDFFNRNHGGDFNLNLHFNIISPKGGETVLENDKLKVTTIPLDHGVDAVGYYFQEKNKPRHILYEAIVKYNIPFSEMGKIKNGSDFISSTGEIIPNELITSPPDAPLSYLHIGDTAYLPNLHQYAESPTLLFHETTYLSDKLDKAIERHHSTARQAAQAALDINAKALLTGHYSSSIRDDSRFEKEAKEIFPNVIAGREGLITDLKTIS